MISTLKRLTPYLKLVTGLSLLLVLVLWVDWPATWAYLRAANLSWLLLGVVLTLAMLSVKAFRSDLLLQLMDVHLSRWQVFEAYISGQALNILLPFRGGEVVRFSMLSAAQPARAAESASTIVVEKLFDAAALVVIVGALLIVLPGDLAGEAMSAVLPKVGALLLFCLVLIFTGFLLWPALSQFFRRNSGGWILSVLLRIDETLLRWRGLLRRPGVMLPVVGLTAVNWLLMGVTNWVGFRAVSLPLGAAAAGLVLALIMIGVLPAISPGNIGPFHFFAALGLRPFGVPVEQGLAFAILLHAVVTLPTLLIGGVLLMLPGLRARGAKAADA